MKLVNRRSARRVIVAVSMKASCTNQVCLKRYFLQISLFCFLLVLGKEVQAILRYAKPT